MSRRPKLAQVPITGRVDIAVSRAYPFWLTPLVILLAAICFPLLPPKVSCSFDLSRSITTDALSQEPSLDLTERVLVRLEQAEKKEQDEHLKTDVRIAWVTTLYASRGNPQPHIDASFKVLGLHPDKVWPSIVAKRKAQLGSEYSLWYEANDSPRLGESLSEAECAAFEFGQDQTASQGLIRPSASSDGVARSHNVAADSPIASSPKKPCKGTKRERRERAA